MKKYLFFILFFLITLPLNSEAATINAISCNAPDVQSAIDQALDGDTVKVPAGTCTWSQTVTIGKITNWTPPATIQSKSITLEGAGIGKTIIIDNIPMPPSGNPNSNMISYLTKLGGVSRITGFTFDSSVISGLDPSNYNPAMINIGGYSQSFRMDHVHLKVGTGNGITVNGFVFGVIDHNIFDLIGWHFGMYIFHSGWNGKQNGDGSWAEAANWGSEKAIFIEDNTFNASTYSTAIDGWSGGRAVFRYNTLNNAGIGNHGLDSGGRLRSMRTMEIYNNNFSTTGVGGRYYYIGQLRGGSFLIHDNTIINNYPGTFFIENYRDFESYSPWGMCDGTSPFDLNDNVTYDTGTYTGTTTSQVLISNGKNWTVNQWQGYHLHNITKGKSDLIISNTKDTITVSQVRAFSSKLMWDNGDSFKILRATVCMDQRGRGKGDLISGSDPIPKAWPNQEVEPTYSWNNTLNGGVANTNLTTNNPWRMKEGVDFFNSPMSGYTPYTYPHPLTLSSITPAPSPVPPPPPPSPTPTPTSTPLPGDLNLDHTVNSLDFSIMNSNWYTSNSTADLNSDSSVNSLDYAILSSNWGKTW